MTIRFGFSDAYAHETTNERNGNILSFMILFVYTINNILTSIEINSAIYRIGYIQHTLITPKFDTDYQVEIIDSGGSEIHEGSFIEAILDMDLLNLNATPDTNRYACYFGGDDQEVVIKNQTAPADGDVDKVLLIKDSYGLPYGAFLSTMVPQLNMIDLRYFDIANLKDYIQAEDFDLVLVMYK